VIRTPTQISLITSEPADYGRHRQADRESDNPKIRGAMGFPGSTPGAIEAFPLDMESKTHVIVFDPIKEQWRAYESFETEEIDHQEMVDRASELVNEWLAESLSDRIAAADETEPEI
jgi:hypothetical protein